MSKIFLFAAFIGASAFAKDVDKLSFAGAEVYAPLKGVTMTAGYVQVKNATTKPVVFKIVKVSPFKAAETHETLEKDGRMSMQKVESFTVPANATFDLKPGGNHIMLFDPNREVKAGEDLNAQFLVDGKPQDVQFKVVPRVETKPASHTGH